MNKNFTSILQSIAMLSLAIWINVLNNNMHALQQKLSAIDYQVQQLGEQINEDTN